MGMYVSYEKPPPRGRIVKRVLLVLGVLAAIYVASFACFVIRGHHDARFPGWEFNYLGRHAWSASPQKEALLFKAYLPLYKLSKLCKIPIHHLAQPLEFEAESR